MVVGLLVAGVALVCLGGIVASFVSELAVRLCRCMLMNFSFSKRSIRALYYLLVSFNVLFVELIKPYAVDWKLFSTWQLPVIAGCGNSAVCVEQQLVFRLSACQTIFFAILFSLMFCGKEIALNAHASVMLFKFLVVPISFAISLFIPNYIVDGFGKFAVYGSVFFLFLQIVALIDFAYCWNESWVANAEDTDNTWWLLAIVGSAAVITFTSIGVAIGTAVGSPSVLCRWFVILVPLTSLVLTGISITDWIPNGALLPSSVIMGCAIYQLWAAFQSYPPYDPVSSSITARKTLSFSLAMLTLGYNSITLSAQPDVYHCTATPPKAAGTVREVLTDYRADDELYLDQDNHVMGGSRSSSEGTPSSASPIFVDVNQLKWFHGVFLAFSVYTSMICTNWLNFDAKGGASAGTILTAPYASFSVLTVSAWGTLALYLWTLVAPKLCPDRVF